MRKRLRKIASLTFRWGIAIVGIWWVVSQMSITDHALIMAQGNRPQEVTVTGSLPGNRYQIKDPNTGELRIVEYGELLNRPDRKTVTLQREFRQIEVHLLAMELSEDQSGKPVVERLLVASAPEGEGWWVYPIEVAGGFDLKVPHPRVQVGLETLFREARASLLVLSIAIFPVTILLTSVRWRKLLKALDISISFGRTFALNTVGMFYNTFIPTGSSGGDFLKAYYVAQHTPHKTRGVMSVFVDRVIGLIVLIMLGGAMATTYWAMAEDYDDPAVRACAYVGTAAAILLLGLVAFLLIAFSPQAKAILQSEWVLSRLPMRKHVESAYEVMAIYRQRPMLILWAMVITVPVHLTVIVSALLAGKAFGLPLTSGYYFIVVPVTVLAANIPISPQGAGFMEFVAVALTARQGATVSQAFALTMSIRLVQILWNLMGGIFVVTGHYRAPKQQVAEISEGTAAAG